MAVGFVDNRGNIIKGRLGEELAKQNPNRGISYIPDKVEQIFYNRGGGGGSSGGGGGSQSQSIDTEVLRKIEQQKALEQLKILEEQKQAEAEKRRIEQKAIELKRSGAQERERILQNEQGEKIRIIETELNKIERGKDYSGKVYRYENLNTGEVMYRDYSGFRNKNAVGGVNFSHQSSSEVQKIKNELAESGLNAITKNGQVTGFSSPDTKKSYAYTQEGINAFRNDINKPFVRFNMAVNDIMSSRMTTMDKTTKVVRKYFSGLNIDTQNRIVSFVKSPTKEADIYLRNKIKKYGGGNALKIFDSLSARLNILPERLTGSLSDAGDFAISSGEKIAAYSRKLRPESFGTYGFGTQKGLQFLLGAGSEITKMTGGILKLPALTLSVIQNPDIIPFLGVQIIGGVINDLTRIKNIRSADATSLGEGTITALAYLLPAVRGLKSIKSIIRKITGKTGARLSVAEINKIKYVASKRLKTLETTLKQKGAITKISGVGLSTTKTGTISQSKYTGLMRIAKRDAVVLQTSSIKLASGASYNSISQIAMKFGNKLIPAIKRVGKNFISFKSNGRIIKIPFSKIKYQSIEMIGWVIDKRGRITANILGKKMLFKNQSKFYKYLQSRHGIKVIKGLYLNPKIKNIPMIKGVSYAYQKGFSKFQRAGIGVKVYKTTRATYRGKVLRKKAGGISIEFTKPTKIKGIGRLKNKYRGLPKLKATIRNAKEIRRIKIKMAKLEKAKAIQRAKTIQKAKAIQRAKTIQISQTKFIPKLNSKTFNRFVKNNLAARTIQKSLIKGATITLLGTAIVARTATGQIRSLNQVSKMDMRQLNREKLKMRQGLIRSTSQITRTITRPTSITRQLTKPLSSLIGSPGTKPPKIIPEEKIPPIPRILLGNFYNKNLSKAVPVYQVVEKIRGNYRKLSPSSLSLKDARDYAVYSIDNRLSKTAFFIPTGKSKTINIPPKQIQNYSARNSFKVRPYRIKFGKKRQLVNGFIEKRRFFNDTPGERSSLRRLRKISPQQRRVLLSRLKKARAVRMRMLRRRR